MTSGIWACPLVSGGVHGPACHCGTGLGEKQRGETVAMMVIVTTFLQEKHLK